ncbi:MULTISPECIES: Imm7 family immunity protein [unclassified Nocardia]|uniref:Imm7 family immunity protein n=1 Tax=unclassified Nocardia TaxID=2637762 RepID=UPI001CE483EB|nr:MULTISPECIES: Imm7 family immunity protein [unclassified Nocardia]
MFEYHGWISLRATAAAVDDEPPLPLAEIEVLVGELSGYALMDLRAMNGNHYVHMGGHPNHRGIHGDRLITMFRRIGELAPGSYGLLYVRDDEDPHHPTEFRVYRMVRGAVTEQADTLLSPVIPVLEDPDTGLAESPH